MHFQWTDLILALGVGISTIGEFRAIYQKTYFSVGNSLLYAFGMTLALIADLAFSAWITAAISALGAAGFVYMADRRLRCDTRKGVTPVHVATVDRRDNIDAAIQAHI